ncbi:MbtH family protein [Salinispora arenicola]|uniref:MbtH family protein n=1 Tax=Salinispora arenicola TaxID=168697 RepID=UPI000372FF2D|nr:MbtH family NRPS accessory protein [Salinispora arenicola]
MDNENDPREWRVVINDEEQHALLPAVLPLPDGWHDTAFTGSEADCIAYVDEQWTDMRPLSLRRALAGDAR